MKDYIITEEDLNWLESCNILIRSNKYARVIKSVRAREKPQTVEELRKALKELGMELSVEWIRKEPLKFPWQYKNPNVDKLESIDIGERGASAGAAAAYAYALAKLREESEENEP